MSPQSKNTSQNLADLVFPNIMFLTMSANLSPILIVDDEKDNLEALQRLLRSQFSVTTTESPVDALKLVQKIKFHVIVSDQRMPEMTGVELLEKVKRLSPATTRILLTGYTDIASVIDAINRGNIYRYIAKPWDPDDFKITLKQADEAYKLRRELEEKNAELSKAVEELKGLDTAKSRFLSLISHELNTPLTILTSFVELLSSEKKTLSGELQKYIGSIGDATTRLSDIVSEVLTYLRMSSGAPVKRKEVTVATIATEALGDLHKTAEKKKVKLILTCDKTLKHALDSVQFKTLIEKLAGDALSRTLPGSEITLHISKKESLLEMTISRTGEPLDVAAFQPLEPASNPMHHQRNMGLALATAKLIIDSHHGSIEAKSTGANSQLLEVHLR